MLLQSAATHEAALLQEGGWLGLKCLMIPQANQVS